MRVQVPPWALQTVLCDRQIAGQTRFFVARFKRRLVRVMKNPYEPSSQVPTSATSPISGWLVRIFIWCFSAFAVLFVIFGPKILSMPLLIIYFVVAMRKGTRKRDKEQIEANIHPCPQCNRELSRNSRFCPRCEYRFADNDA